MKTYVGFAFTDFYFGYLQKCGFYVTQELGSENLGYKSFIIPFDNGDKIEIREIIDENLYLKNHPIKHFEPYIVEEQETQNSAAISHPNTAHEINSAIKIEDLSNGKLLFHFRIHKNFSLCGLIIKCKNFSEFLRISQVDHKIEFNHKEFCLLQMGTCCFDILVSD